MAFQDWGLSSSLEQLRVGEIPQADTRQAAQEIRTQGCEVATQQDTLSALNDTLKTLNGHVWLNDKLKSNSTNLINESSDPYIVTVRRVCF